MLSLDQATQEKKGPKGSQKSLWQSPLPFLGVPQEHKLPTHIIHAEG